MMVLHFSPLSPFVRKVRIGAAMLGLDGEIETVTTNTLDPDDPVRRLNPLGKIPALIPEDGTAIYDSAVILEYLDHRAGGGMILPPPGAARFRVLTEQVLADGIMEAAVLKVYEARFRPQEKHDAAWLAYQGGKVERALAAFEHTQPQGARTVADIALACALGYLDFRFPGTWRATHPRLVAWLDSFAATVPSFDATRAPV